MAKFISLSRLATPYSLQPAFIRHCRIRIGIEPKLLRQAGERPFNYVHAEEAVDRVLNVS